MLPLLMCTVFVHEKLVTVTKRGILSTRHLQELIAKSTKLQKAALSNRQQNEIMWLWIYDSTWHRPILIVMHDNAYPSKGIFGLLIRGS
jgi:hypothetical protein